MRAADLYRHYAEDGTLLYVGVSLSTMKRLAQHRDNSSWYAEIATCKIEHFDTREAALAAEQVAVQSEQPRYNIRLKKKVVPIKEVREKAEESRDYLLRTLVKFDPVYSLERAAEILSLKSPSVVLRLIQSGQLGSIQLPPRRPDGKPKTAVSGWQLLEYIEALENASQAKVA